MSSYAAWTAKTKQQTQGTIKTQARAARNDFRLVGMVLSLFKKEKNSSAAAAAAAASGSASGGSSSSTGSLANKPKWNIVLQLGSLQNNPDVKKEIVDASERFYREFEIVSKATATNKINEYRGEVPKFKRVYSHDVLSCSVLEEELGNSGGIVVGDLVEIRGINFSNWYSKVQGVERITTYCNVDKITRVKGAERSNYAYDLFMESGRPVRRVTLETGEGDHADGGGGEQQQQQGVPQFKPKLGREAYALNYFGNDAAKADAYLARPEYEIYQFEFEPKADPTNPQKQIVTYRPDIFNKAAGSGFIVENGFKTIATGTQHFADGSEQTVLAWLKMQREHVAPFGISDEQTWNAVGPRLLEQCKYTTLVKENLDKTANESFNTAGDDDGHEEEGVDFKLAASVQTVLVNLPEEIERIGVLVPPEHVADLMGTLVQQGVKGGDVMLASPMHEGAYHNRPDRGSVISLNEYSGNLTELIKQDSHNFYIVPDLSLDEETRALLNNEPADKHYLMFDARFRAAINKEKGAAAKLAAAKKFGLGDDTEMTQLVALGGNAKSRVFYAVLKPERRVRDYLDRAAFVEAVRLYVPDPDATLARLRKLPPAAAAAPAQAKPDEAGGAEEKQGVKRAADKEVDADPDVKRKGAKRAKKNADEPSSSHHESADEASTAAPASPARKGGKKHKH
jgi:hypothetical protein